jgi:hypothetical protein
MYLMSILDVLSFRVIDTDYRRRYRRLGYGARHLL